MRYILRPASAAIVLSAVLVLRPTDAHAGLMDFIWDMSGPQMAGFVVRCRVPDNRCNLFGIQLTEEIDVMTARRAWVSLEGGLYRSTGKNEGEGKDKIDFRAWRTEMVAFEPIFEFSSRSSGPVRVFHGAGATLQFFFGQDFRRFRKSGIKVRPIAFEFGDHWEAALNVRLYPEGFGADQIGLAQPITGNRPFERTWGVMAGYKW